MNIRTLGRYLLGRPDAIDAVARDPAAPWVGLALALLAGIPREYDQESLLHGPLLLLLPAAASSILGGLYYLFLTMKGLKWSKGGEWQFMGLIWATAPLAWLYAIPVETLLDPLNAARANVALLAVVATWRVLLFARVVQVLSGMRFSVVLAQQLFLASIPIVLSAPFRTIPLVGLMGGVLRTPAMEFLLAAQDFTTYAAMGVFVVCLGSLFMQRGYAWNLPAFHPTPGKPWGLLLSLSLLGAAAMAWAQPSLIRFESVRQRPDFQPGPAALRALADLGPEGIPPTHSLPFTGGDLMRWDGFEMVSALEEETPPWLQEAYLGDLQAKLAHERFYFNSALDEKFSRTLAALAEKSFGRAWLREHQELLRKVAGQRDSEAAGGKPRTPLSLAVIDRLRDTDFAPLPPPEAPAPTP